MKNTGKDTGKDTGEGLGPEEIADHPLLEELAWLESRPGRVGAGEGGAPTGEAMETEAPAQEALRAYRHGELPEPEAEALEKVLIRDQQARTRLAALAGRDLPQPSPFLRARVLRAFKTETSGFRRRSIRWTPLLAAALVLISVAGVFFRGGFGPEALPEALSYEVAVGGVAEVRSGELEAGDVVEAYAETPLEIVVAPTGMAEGDVGFAIYGREGEDWLRKIVAESAQVEGGVATFRISAGELVGSEPGRHDLLIVVARPDDLPSRLSGLDLDAKLDSGHGSDPFRRYYRQGLQLLP